MNRAALFSVYYQHQVKSTVSARLCSEYPELLTESPLEPEFVSAPTCNSPQKRHLSDDSTSIANTISLCSNFSRVTMDRVLYADILRKRKEHRVFLEIEAPECHNDTLWYFVDDKSGMINGPFTPIEMNLRFEMGVFSERTKLKKKFEESYIPLSVIIKRYFKNYLCEKLDINKGAAALPSRIARFKKGETPKIPGRNREMYEQRNREARVFSDLVRPNFVDLKQMLPADFDDEFGGARQRANTNPVRSF
jgi:hypothetical protein